MSAGLRTEISILCGHIFFLPLRSKIGGILFLSCLSLWNSVWNFNLANNVLTVNDRALVFNMSTCIPSDKTLPWVPTFFTLWPWPCTCSLTYLLKTLTLLITFQQWVLELCCFTWVFLVIRPFCKYQHFLHCDLDLGVWPTFLKL